jgi:uncharacterized glyoxalase superfamily protein PhnB
MDNFEKTDQSANTRPLAGVIANIAVRDGKAAVEFYSKAFAAQVLRREETPDGKLMHCHLRINDGDLMLNDFFPEHGYAEVPPQAFVLHLQVNDVDTWWNRALAQGCQIAMPLEKQFWGDRYGQMRDPFGIVWSMGSPDK